MSLLLTALGKSGARMFPQSDKVEVRPGLTCHPPRLHPERSRPVERRWQTLRPSVPVGPPAASGAIPAGPAPPAAAAPGAQGTGE